MLDRTAQRSQRHHLETCFATLRASGTFCKDRRNPEPQGQKGKLVLAGALQEPVDGALFVFKGASVEEIESFVAAVSLQTPF